MLLKADSDLALPSSAQYIINAVRLDLFADDGMYHGNDRHYLSCGASALNVIMSAVQTVDAGQMETILDFGAGAGRVMRWLRAAYPSAAISACDIRANDMLFCEQHFGARTWISGTNIGSLRSLEQYDLIWMGSVITHLSSDNSIRILEKMISWTTPGGVILMSFHGRHALRRQDSGKFRYIHDDAWKLIRTAHEETGYGYADYEGQTGYGISLMKPSWIASVFEGRADIRLVMLAEAAWDGHHDVLAVQRVI